MYRAQAADEQAAAQLAWDKEQYARNEAFKREQYEYQKQLDAEANAQAWAKINAKKSGSDDESGGKKNVKVKYTGGASNEKVSSADEEYVRKAIAFNKKMPEETRMKAAADLIEELKAQGYSQSAAEQLVAYYYDK